MNRILSVLFLLSLVLINHCAWNDERAFAESKKEFEGWGGAPEDPYKKPFDFYYMTGNGRASLKALALAKKYPTIMERSCIDAVTTAMKGNLVGKLFDEFQNGYGGTTSDSDNTAIPVIREFKGELRGVKVKECKPLYREEKDFPGSAWKECECIAYTKIPGGRNTIISRLEKNKG